MGSHGLTWAHCGNNDNNNDNDNDNNNNRWTNTIKPEASSSLHTLSAKSGNISKQQKTVNESPGLVTE